MIYHSVIYTGQNTAVIEVVLTDGDDAVVENATVEVVEVRERDNKLPVDGITTPFPMAHSNDGVYLASIDGEIFTLGHWYELVIRATTMAGYRAEFVEALRAAVRRA